MVSTRSKRASVPPSPKKQPPNKKAPTTPAKKRNFVAAANPLPSPGLISPPVKKPAPTATKDNAANNKGNNDVDDEQSQASDTSSTASRPGLALFVKK